MGEGKVRVATVTTVVLTTLVWLAPAASAACHRFTLEVSPTSPAEGETVTVTVTRDAAVDDSSVTVSTSAGTAQPGSDFSALQERIEFTGSEVERSVTIEILADDTAEGSEDFTVGLGNPGGCAVNPNFSLADDVTVTIAADEPAQTGPAEEPATEDSPEPVEESPVVTQEEDLGEAEEDDEGGGFPVGLAIAALVVLIGAGAFIAYRKRSAA